MAQLYMNGVFTDEDDARVSPFDRGFLYGDGLFETIRADRGTVEFLDDHVQRLTDSAAALNITVPNTDWDNIITRLISLNGLERETARVKIIITRGTEPGLHLRRETSPTLIITAAEHTSGKKPERIGIYPEKRLNPVSKYKSLNYLFNLQARDWAAQKGYDEAVLTGGSGEILECAASNIFIEKNGMIIRPLNEGCHLEGVMGNHFIHIKKEEGFPVRDERVFPEDIQNDDAIYITNSMIGVCEVILEDAAKLRH